MAAPSATCCRRLRESGCNESMIGDAAATGTFADGLIDYVDKLVAVQQPPSEHFAFGSLTVDLSVFGDAFRRRLTTPIDFARLPPTNCRASEWRIVAVDGIASGSGPPPKMNFEAVGGEQVRRGLQRLEQRLMVYYDPVTLTLRMLSSRRRLAVIWTPDAARIPEWEDYAPLRDLLHWMTLPTECFLAHAAAIGVAKAGVLLMGPSGSGKSTTTAAAALRGLKIAGDDFVLIDPRPVRAYALYDYIKLDSNSTKWFPDLKGEIVNPMHGPAEKGRIPLAQSRPQTFARWLPIAAALLPHVTSQATTTITRASPSEAVRALFPSTISIVAGGAAEMFQKSAAFLRNLPAHHCNLGTDPFEVIDTISAFVGDLAR
jgi:hypothetical protein